MKKKILILSLIFLIVIPIFVFADTLKLNITVDNEKPKLDEVITVKVKWDVGMQAADFSLNYNPEKLEFLETNLDEVFINNDVETGKIRVAWISLDNTDKTEIDYKFKVTKNGKLEFSTNIEGGFATGELEMPSDYINESLIINVSSINLVFIIIPIIIIILLILIIKRKK